MKFNIELTWSKIIALIVLILSYDLGANLFMYALPFVVFLITGKQVKDALVNAKKGE